MATIDDLQKALRAKVGYETVHVEEDENSVVLMGRLHQPPENLLLVSHQLLVAALDSSWDHEASKVFVLKGRKLVHAWRVIFQWTSGDFSEHAAEVLRVIHRTPKAKQRELASVELPGGGRHRTSYKDGKGAGLTGQHKTGAAAALSAFRGGR